MLKKKRSSVVAQILSKMAPTLKKFFESDDILVELITNPRLYVNEINKMNQNIYSYMVESIILTTDSASSNLTSNWIDQCRDSLVIDTNEKGFIELELSKIKYYEANQSTLKV